jgi:hypothetical protein
MGATTFITKAKGKTAEKAFKKTVKEHTLDYGRNGYTGTIAEKSEFVMIDEYVPNDMISAEEFATKLMYDCDPRVDDKWGPAGCIPLGDKEFLFFGWA